MSSKIITTMFVRFNTQKLLFLCDMGWGAYIALILTWWLLPHFQRSIFRIRFCSICYAFLSISGPRLTLPSLWICMASHRKCIYSIGKCPIRNSARHRENNNKKTTYYRYLSSYDAFLFLIWHCLFLLLWTYFILSHWDEVLYSDELKTKGNVQKKSTQM